MLQILRLITISIFSFSFLFIAIINNYWSNFEMFIVKIICFIPLIITLVYVVVKFLEYMILNTFFKSSKLRNVLISYFKLQFSKKNLNIDKKGIRKTLQVIKFDILRFQNIKAIFLDVLIIILGLIMIFTVEYLISLIILILLAYRIVLFILYKNEDLIIKSKLLTSLIICDEISDELFLSYSEIAKNSETFESSEIFIKLLIYNRNNNMKDLEILNYFFRTEFNPYLLQVLVVLLCYEREKPLIELIKELDFYRYFKNPLVLKEYSELLKDIENGSVSIPYKLLNNRFRKLMRF